MDKDTEEVARRLRGLKRFRIHVMASGVFEVTAESEEKAEKKARTQFDWVKYLDNFELVEVEETD